MKKHTRLLLLILCVSVLAGLLLTNASGTEIVDFGNCGAGAEWITDEYGSTIRVGGDAVHWSLNSDGKLKIYGRGEIETDYFPWRDHTDLIKTAVVDSGVTNLPRYAFAYLPNLETVTVGRDVAEIGSCPLASSGAVKTVAVDSANIAYRADADGVIYSADMTVLAAAHGGLSGTYTVTEGVKKIAAGAFEGCHRLDCIELPSTLTEVVCPTFKSDMIHTISVSAENPNFSSLDGVLYNKDKSEIIEAPCGLAGHFTVPDTVKKIHAYAFNYCREMTGVTLPEGIEEMGEYAFDTTGIVDIFIPASLRTIGAYSFANCHNLQKIRVDGNNPNYSADEAGVLYDKAKLELYEAPCDIEGVYYVPDTVIELGDRCFKDCHKLNVVVLPAADLIITDETFANCFTLSKIRFTGGKVTVDASAFADCTLTAYYPRGDSYYESLAKGEYSGNVTWKGYDLRNPEPDIDAIVEKNFIAWEIYEDKILEISGEGVLQAADLATVPKERITEVRVEHSITVIGPYAFSGFDHLTTVSLPETVYDIEAKAFEGCASLVEIKIPSGVQNLEPSSFNGCVSLARIIIDPKNDWLLNDERYVVYSFDRRTVLAAPKTLSGSYTVHENAETISFDAFYQCHSLTEIRLPSKLKAIGEYSFMDCDSLKSVVFPDSLEIIMDDAFRDCDSLTSVTLPAKVRWLGNYETYSVFADCDSLTEIKVDGKNENFKSENGILYYADGSILLQIPGGRSGAVTVPDSVHNFDRLAFAGCRKITSLTFPPNNLNLQSELFADMEKLSELYFTGGIASFRAHTFTNVTATVYYPAGDSRWNDVIGHDYGGHITWRPNDGALRLRGDVNGDGEVTNTDLVTVARYIVGLCDTETSSAVKLAADMNSDGRVDNTDLVTVARVIVGL